MKNRTLGVTAYIILMKWKHTDHIHTEKKKNWSENENWIDSEICYKVYTKNIYHISI